MHVLDEHSEAAPATTPSQRRTLRGGGAPLLPPAIAYVVLAVAAIVVPPAVAGESAYSSDASLLDFYAQHGGAARLMASLVLASAIPFAVVTAVASHRVRLAGLDVPGRLIALVGGTGAAVLLSLSGLLSLALTRPHVADSPTVVRGLSGLAFAAGGPGFVVFSGLLVAGISVPALVGRLMPPWIGWCGLTLALLCELAILSATTSAFTPLLPISRFATMAWLLAVAVTLPAQRDVMDR